ncbi:MAG TPA: LysR family transcriptional regulator [Ramlibacter sp.]|nr:LysR family transcriptional regulator [Ramlibacter sp.]
MNFTIKQLRAFAMVADLQSFSLAARRINLTPGAVSLLIRDLEIEVGFSLFDRTTRRVALSKAGREYLPAAQQVLRQVQAAAMAANDVKNQATGIVRVAAPLIVAHSMLPSAIAAYRQTHPDVLVRPVDCTVEDLVHIVEEDHADLAIGPDRPTSDLVDRIALYDSRWVLWCSPRRCSKPGKRIASFRPTSSTTSRHRSASRL